MAETTKKALSASLKKLITRKSLDKITVTDIVEDCEVNRQTFYYHFKDIYDLVEWIYTNDATRAIGDKKTYGTWQQGYLQIFEYALQNKAFVLGTYHSLNREYLERYLYSETFELLGSVVEELAEGMSVRSEDKAFIAHFYKYAFVGLMLEWIGSGMKESPEAIVRRVSTMLHGDFVSNLEKLQSSRPFLDK